MTRLQTKVISLSEDRDNKDATIESLKQVSSSPIMAEFFDINTQLCQVEQVVHNRMSALIAEHRELKNHWLAEKSDLQSRFAQIQAQNTATHGTLKKKEKDYDKLQIQLSKLVKDANRGQKGCVTISQPLKKTLSQETTNTTAQAVLRDAEVVSLRNTLTALGRDNASLRSSVEQLQNELVKLKLVEAAPGQVIPMSVPTSPMPASATAVVPAEEEGNKQQKADMPAAASIMMPQTPGTKSVSWLVEQTHTVVKKLRTRAENAASGAIDNHEKTEEENATFNPTALLKLRLDEALRVIEQQDRLIHDALMGCLPGQTMSLDATDELDFMETDAALSSSSSSRRDSFNIDEMLLDANLLPPASPETLQLLEHYGWTLPKPAPLSTRRSLGGKINVVNNAGMMKSARKVTAVSQSVAALSVVEVKPEALDF